MIAEPLPVHVADPEPANSQDDDPFASADLELLKPKQRQAVELKLQGKTRREIADALGTTLGTVGVILWSAKKRLGIPTNKKLTPFSRVMSPGGLHGRAGGLKGGPARAAALTPERRQEIAREAIKARWARREAARAKIAEKIAAARARAKPLPPVRLAPPPPPPPPPEPAPAPEDDSLPTPLLARMRDKIGDNRFNSRSKTVGADRLSKDEKRAAALIIYPDDVERPRTRGDCEGGERPCPFVSCAHHLYLDADEKTGAIKVNFPHLEVWEMTESCSLDVADRDGETLENVGRFVNLTRERVRQIEVSAVERAKLDAAKRRITG